MLHILDVYCVSIAICTFRNDEILGIEKQLITDFEMVSGATKGKKKTVNELSRTHGCH